MAEALQAAVGVDRLVAVQVEAAVHRVLPGLAARREPEVLHQNQLGRREAVVDFGHADLLARILDARLNVGVPRALDDLGERREVVVLALGALGGAGHERQRLDEDRVVVVLVSVLGAADDRRRGAVGDARAVHDAEHAGDLGRGVDLLDRDLALELRLLVAGAVVVVLVGDLCEDVAHRLQVDAVLLGVGGSEEREVRRRGHAGLGAVARRGAAGEAGEPGVLQLLHADRHDQVVGAGRNRVGGVADRLAASGAHVLEPGDRLVLDLERLGERQARDAAAGGAEPVGVDVVRLDSGGAVGLLHGIDQQIAGAAVPVFTELGAAHADDGYAITDSLAGHWCSLVVLRTGPSLSGVVPIDLSASGAPSRSSCVRLPQCTGGETSFPTHRRSPPCPDRRR